MSLVPAFNSRSRVEGEFNRETNAGEHFKCVTHPGLDSEAISVNKVSSGTVMAFKWGLYWFCTEWEENVPPRDSGETNWTFSLQKATWRKTNHPPHLIEDSVIKVLGQIQINSLETLKLLKNQAGVYQRTQLHEQFCGNIFCKPDSHLVS